MRTYAEIGCTPASENCAQLGILDDYTRFARLECNAYIKAMRLKFGEPPAGARYHVHGNSHDFGTYYDVRLIYDATLEDHNDYALKIENGLDTWEEVGFWAPVSYDDRNNVVHVIEHPDLWLKETNPHCYKTIEERCAGMIAAAEQPQAVTE